MSLDNEEAVARALEVTSLQDLSDRQKIELAALLPEIPEPLRSQLYDLVPGLRAIELAAVDAYERTYVAGLDTNDKNQQRLHDSFAQTRDVIEGKLTRDDLSEEYERYLLDSLKEADRLEAQKDTENKAFIASEARATRRAMLFATLGVPVVTVIVSVGAQVLMRSGSLRVGR